MHSGQLIRLVPDDDLGVWISAFLHDCRLVELAPETINFYSGNLRRYH